MTPDIAHHDREDGRLAGVLISDLLKTRGARPPDLESENEFLHSLAQHLLTDPEHILERSIRAAARLCGAPSAGVSLLETEHGNEVFRWVALGGALEGQEGRSTPRFFSPCGLAFDRQTPQLFSYPARYYTCLHGVVPEIVEALVVPLPDGTGTIWIVAHDGTVPFDGEHVRLLTGLATFMATSLRLLRLTRLARRAGGETRRDMSAPHGGTTASARIGPESALGMQLSLPLLEDPVALDAAKAPTPANVRMRAVTRADEMNEVVLSARALMAEARVLLRDSRTRIRRCVAVSDRPEAGDK
jgi:hypothetical protein